MYPAVIALAGVLCGCSSPRARSQGRVVVAITVDWEGAAFTPEGLDALDELRKRIQPAPITHFVSAAYFTKERPEARATAYLTEAVRPGDELAVHLHAWRSLARASGIEPKLSPSFVTGTDKLYEFEDGDIGFDTDLDVYNVAELRAMIRTSAKLLEQTTLPVARTFRAGGYLGTPKVLEALRQEGFTADSSATDYRQIDAHKDSFLSRRVKEVWPKVDTASQPFFADGHGRQLIELPIAATADYVTTADIVALVEAAAARLQKEPDRDVFVVIGCNQETAQEFAGRIGDAIASLRDQRSTADHLLLTTIDKAVAMARNQVAPPPGT
jgi:predicted deacetylase